MSAVDVAVGVPEADAGHHGPWALALRRLLRNRTAMASVVVLVVIVITAGAAPYYAKHIARGRPVRVQRDRHHDRGRQAGAGHPAQPVGPRLDADRPDARAPLLPRRRLAGPRRDGAPALRRADVARGLDRRRAADLADRDLARARRRLLRRLGRRGDLALPRHPVGVPGLPAGDRALDGAAPAGREDRAGQRRPGVAVAADHHHRRRLRALRRAPGARRGVLDPPPRVHGGRDRGRREGPAADPRRDAAERAAGGARVAAADDRDEHRHRGGALVPLDRRPGAERELGDDRRGRPEPALHAAVGVDRAGRADRDHRARAQRARRRRARRARPARLAAHPAPHAGRMS